MIKYVLHPGYVLSKHDRDVHYIGAQRLMDLYRVKPNECVVYDPDRHGTDGLIPLYPSYDGNYNMEKK